MVRLVSFCPFFLVLPPRTPENRTQGLLVLAPTADGSGALVCKNSSLDPVVMCSEGRGPSQARCVIYRPLFLHLCIHVMCHRGAGGLHFPGT